MGILGYFLDLGVSLTELQLPNFSQTPVTCGPGHAQGSSKNNLLAKKVLCLWVEVCGWRIEKGDTKLFVERIEFN